MNEFFGVVAYLVIAAMVLVVVQIIQKIKAPFDDDIDVFMLAVFWPLSGFLAVFAGIILGIFKGSSWVADKIVHNMGAPNAVVEEDIILEELRNDVANDRLL